jgi:plasmid stabilization system protein ParE
VSAKPLPKETIRDLLGIARALYVVRNNQRAAQAELDRIREVSAWLVDALELARARPDTLGHRAAWFKAERATAALTALLIEHDECTQRLVGAWAERFR